ncbi:MAG: cobalt ECF transporter T component CbiQ [Marinifilaceae bacterium]
MFIIDKLSYQNRLRQAHPAEKLLFTLGLLSMALLCNSFALFAAILILTFLILWQRAGVPVKYLILLYSLPCLFGFISVLPIVVGITTTPTEYDTFLNFGTFGLIFPEENLARGLQLYLRILTSASSFYLLILTTPVPDLEYLLRKLRLPSIITELFLLIYRFIFILMNMAGQILISQRSRLGYRSFSSSWNSFKQLIASLLARSYIYSQNSYQALLSRGYNGRIHLLDGDYKYSLSNFAWIVFCFISLIILNYYG